MGLMQFIQAAAQVVLVFMAIGIMFGLIKLRSVVFFLLALLFLPFLFSAASGSVQSVFSTQQSWKVWLALIAAGLVALRLFFNRVFRR